MSEVRRILRLALLVAFVAALVIYLRRNRAILDAVLAVDRRVLAAMLLTNVAMQLVAGVRYRQLCLAAGYRVPVWESCLLSWWFALVNLLLPLQAGVGARAWYLKQRHGVPLSSAAALMLANNAIVAGAAGLGLLATATAAALGGTAAPWFVWAAAGLLLLPSLAFATGLPGGWSLPAGRVGGWLALARRDWDAIRARPVTLAGSAALQVGFFALLGLNVWLGYRTVGAPVPLAAAAASASASTVTAMLNLVPGNFGLQELVIGWTGGLSGAAFRDGIAAALVVRAPELTVLLGGGLVAAAWVLGGPSPRAAAIRPADGGVR